MQKYGISLIVFSVLWGIIGIILPFVVPKGPNRRLTQVMLILTAIACWLFWFCVYIHQLNPLFGPQLTGMNARVLRILWGPKF